MSSKEMEMNYLIWFGSRRNSHANINEESGVLFNATGRMMDLYIIAMSDKTVDHYGKEYNVLLETGNYTFDSIFRLLCI